MAVMAGPPAVHEAEEKVKVNPPSPGVTVPCAGTEQLAAPVEDPSTTAACPTRTTKKTDTNRLIEVFEFCFFNYFFAAFQSPFKK